MELSLQRSQKLSLIAPPAAFALYGLGLAFPDYVHHKAGLGTFLLFGAALVAITYSFRVLSMGVSVKADAIESRGVIRGWIVQRRDVTGVVRIRRVLGWRGLAITTSDGRQFKLPIFLSNVSEDRFDAMRLNLLHVLEGQ